MTTQLRVAHTESLWTARRIYPASWQNSVHVSGANSAAQLRYPSLSVQSAHKAPSCVSPDAQQRGDPILGIGSTFSSEV
jgi:hypothetical protein